MAFSEKHKWCCSKILEAFQPEVDSDTVQLFLRQDVNLQKFTGFFKGEGNSRLFVFYQPEQAEGEVCSSIHCYYCSYDIII